MRKKNGGMKKPLGYRVYRFFFRSSRPEVFLRKAVLKICSKFTGEHTHAECDFNKVAKQLY